MSKITYKDSGVDIGANTRWVAAIEAAMRSTYGPRVVQDRHGGFAGMFRLELDRTRGRSRGIRGAGGKGRKRRVASAAGRNRAKARSYKKPVLVGCSDGVGTKVLIAIKMNRLDTIGIDLVAMNVNDLICCGAEPLFFLDYLAVSKLDPRSLQAVIEGVAAGCREAGCALLGGETAEMPDLYAKGDFDLAGFSVGVVEQSRVIDGSRVEPGDLLVGLPSSGIHSNGYSLVRRLIAKGRCKLDKVYDDLGEPLGDALLRPTRIYVRSVRAVLDSYPVKRVVSAMVHVTGGGLKENIVRVLPAGCDAVINKKSLKPPPVFEFLRKLGTTRAEMLKVFNMGVGFVFVVRAKNVDGVMEALREAGERPFRLGRVKRGTGRVQFK